ncbi:MAG: acetyltransferase, partial [Candidatus Adiutrix sp.]|nr:acetyltransferase [Candidatus Adiutrix sp.]
MSDSLTYIVGPQERPKQLRPEPIVDEAALVIDSSLGAWTEIGPGTELHGVEMDDYFYTGSGCHLMYCRIGKFVNIANNVR